MIDGDNVIVTWDLPDYRGSVLTAYKILFRQSDLTTYTETLPNCDGSVTEIIDGRTCTVSIATLMAAPFNLPWGSDVYVKVSSENVYGKSF